jgi:hypothetical protein
MPVIPATEEAEIGRIMVLEQPRQKVSKTSFQQAGMVVPACDLSYSGGVGR